MKHIYLFILTSLTFSLTQAQIVDIPDANFKNALVNTNCVDTNDDGTLDADADLNDDGEIQVSEALQVLYLTVWVSDITNISGIEEFTNLIRFNCEHNDLTELDLSQNVNLEEIRCTGNDIINLTINGLNNLLDLRCSGNALTQINTSQNPSLLRLECYDNEIIQFDLSQNISLTFLRCDDNQLTELDLSQNYNLDLIQCSDNLLTEIDFSGNLNLTSISINNNALEFLDLSMLKNIEFVSCSYNDLKQVLLKNGVIADYGDFHILANPNLEYLCIDEEEREVIEYSASSLGLENIEINSYCSFVPGGDFYKIEGQNKLDVNANGCDVNDIFIPNLKFSITDGSVNGEIVSNGAGVYTITTYEGMHTITPILEVPEYFNISPESITVDFPTETSPFNQDFCITPNGIREDLEIAILPLEVARPGFDTDYKIIYKNKGTTTLSGTLELIYNENDDLIDFVSATPNIDSDVANVLTWSYSSLQPFETREILVTFNLNTPTETPPLNGGDSLGLVANIYPLTTDATPLDNNFQLKQIVVNSLDPNDKTCLQGETITPEQVGKYVHYMIRFENTGTASAVNIVVKDEIDLNKFDVSTLIPLNSSHDFVTNIKEDNIVEFIFENIYLPFEDATNDGYVVFKIKTLETLVLGDTFANDAEIYFDYNAPIITNDEETTVAVNLSVAESTIQDAVKIFPNPVYNTLFIESKNTLETISIYDVNGRQLKIISLIGNKQTTEINTSTLSKGIYFVKIKTQVGIQTTKIIKN